MTSASQTQSVIPRCSPRLRRASKEVPRPPFEGRALRGRLRATSCASRELNIEHAAVRFYLPGLDRVVVVDRVKPTLFSQLCNGRLHKAGLVDDAGLKQRRPAVPAPRQREPRQRLCQHRLVQLRALPVDAAIDGNVDLANLALAGPGQPADFV